jgi:esterase/lipase superfamily enzyme
VALIRDRLRASRNFQDQALVFVHGYNNLFDDALFRTAQIAYDLKYDGAPFLYSWPSGAGIAGYPYDSNSAQQAEQYFSQFLQMVLKETGAQNVSIIAHSMGNQLLLQALRNLDRSHPEVARINQIILAAPDVDRDSFQFLAAQIRDVGKGITMYASSNDVALGISRRFAGGVPRAGDVPVGLGPIVVGGVDTIDVSALSTEYLSLNHSSYAEKTGLLKDIELVLRTGVRPPEIRLPLLERIKGGQGDYWRYPK